MIVKVQRPVAGYDFPMKRKQPDILVYAEGRAHQTIVHFADLPSWLRRELHERPKVFAEIERRGDKLVFLKLAEDQSW
jgi:hypothetical protein